MDRGRGCYGCDRALPEHGPYPPPVATWCTSCLRPLSLRSKAFIWRHWDVSTLCLDCFERIHLRQQSSDGLCWLCSAFTDSAYRLHIRVGERGDRVLYTACSESHFETLLRAVSTQRTGRCGGCSLDHDPRTVLLEVQRPDLWWFDPRRWKRTVVI